jgi:hypothetical protein
MEYGNTSVYRIRVIIQYMYHQKHNIPQYAEYKQTLGMQLPEKYKENFDVSSEASSPYIF